MLFPEPLFEAGYIPKKQVCLCCGKAKANSVMYACINFRIVTYLCPDCSSNWNFYGYHIFKKIKTKNLLFSLIKYKLRHPINSPSWYSIYKQIRIFGEWGQNMRKFMKGRND